MRCGALLVAVCAAGCGDGELGGGCDGVDGTCIELVVEGSGAVRVVDQLEVLVGGAASFDARTPPTPGPALTLPVRTALLLHGGGSFDVTVLGYLGGHLLGIGAAAATVAPAGHVTITVTLVNYALPDGGIGDRDVFPWDLSPPPDLSDLVPPPRLAFLLPARPGALGDALAVDQACTVEAAASGHGGQFRALVAWPGMAPAQRIKLGAGRDIVRFDGTKVATDETLWKGNLLAPINRMANGGFASAQCVWTNATITGDVAQADDNGDCAGWTDGVGPHTGVAGNPLAVASQWIDAGPVACATKCHVYCIEE